MRNISREAFFKDSTLQSVIDPREDSDTSSETQTNKKLELSVFKHYLKPLICCRKEQRRLFSSADTKINEYLDLLKFIKRMQILDSTVQRINSQELKSPKKEAISSLDDR